jgi:hypothetical protein
VEGLQITRIRALKIWWYLLWRGLLLGGLAGAIVGFILGFFLTVAGAAETTIRVVTQISGGVVAIPIGIWIVMTLFEKRFADFRLILVALGKEDSNDA